MDINFIECVEAGGASTAIDALRSSAHPMSSLYFVANNQRNNMINKQVFRHPSCNHSVALFGKEKLGGGFIRKIPLNPPFSKGEVNRYA